MEKLKLYQYIIKYNPLSMRCQLLERNYFKIFKNILEKGRVARRLEDGNGENEASGMTHSPLGELNDGITINQ